MFQKYAFVAVLALAVVPQVRGANWGHWRGEFGNGVSATAKPPTTWSGVTNVKWKAVIPGRGSGSPVVWESRVFVVSAVSKSGETAEASRPATGSDRQRRRQRFGGQRGRSNRGGELRELQFVLMCFDRENGKLLWQETATTARPHEGTHSTNGFASASPCTDGEHVYAHFGSRGLYCYTMDGELKWKREFGRMTTRSTFGEGSSPTLAGEKIIVPWDHEGQSYLFALNKLTGEIIWRTARDEPTCWATPLVIEHKGKNQVVMNGQNFARAYDLETGEELWLCAGQTERPVASPVAENGLVFVGSGFRGYFLGAFRLDGDGDIQGTSNVAWTVSRDTPDIASPLLSNGRLYYYKGKSGLLTCVDAKTGTPHYTTERTGLASIYASPIAAGGHVYLTDRSGTTVVITDSDKLNIVATNSVGETVDATPAPVDGELFIRGERHLFCIAE